MRWFWASDTAFSAGPARRESAGTSQSDPLLTNRLSATAHSSDDFHRCVQTPRCALPAARSGRLQIRKQAVVFLLHDRVALARALFDSLAIQHGDVSARIADEAGLLQLERAFGHAFTAHAEHVGDQLLGHHELVSLQPIEAEQEPATQLL